MDTILNTGIPLPSTDIASTNMLNRLKNPETCGPAVIARMQENVDWQPDMHFLDLGSGIGRMACTLIEFLNENGRYEGLDIDARRIQWCQDEITERYPNFRFAYADIYNRMYNTTATVQAAEYIFPYADNTFDFVYAHSVFTHMVSADVSNYLAQIEHVLKPNGVAWLTCFLLTEDRISLTINDPENLFANLEPVDETMTHFYPKSVAFPERLVIYTPEWIEAEYKRTNLQIENVIKWSQQTNSWQDVVIARKS